MMSPMKTLTLLLAVLMLSACSSSFRSNVATFHNLSSLQGEQMFFSPLDKDKLDSIEFQQYAAMLSAQFRQLGYTMASTAAEADLIVEFGISVGPGRERHRSSSYGVGYMSGFGAHHGYSGHYSGNFGAYGGNYGRPSYTIYTTVLTVQIRQQDGEILYEGQADTETQSRTLPEVTFLLAEALLKDFPGENGVTRRVKIDLED